MAGHFTQSETDTLVGHSQAVLTGESYYREVARGRVPGASVLNAYGRHTTAGAESGVIWPNGAYAFPPSAGVQLSIVSTSANDAAAGTGIRTIVIKYLDNELVSQLETVTLNGITPVLTVATNIRFVQCMFRETSGTGIVAAGTIDAVVGAQVYSEILVGQVRCTSSVQMVPKGKRLIVCALSAGAVSGAGAAQVIVEPASPNFEGYDLTAEGVFMPLLAAGFQDNSLSLALPVPLVLTEGQSMGMIFEADKLATVLGAWFGVLENA